MSTYKVVNDFQVNAMRVLVLDKDYEPTLHKIAIDGKEYSSWMNSVRNVITVRSTESFKGKTVVVK